MVNCGTQWVRTPAVAACVRAERMTSTAFACLFAAVVATTALLLRLEPGTCAPGIRPLALA